MLSVLLSLLVAGQALDEGSRELRCIRKARKEMARITGFAAFVNKEWENDGLGGVASTLGSRSVSWVEKDADNDQRQDSPHTSKLLLVQ
jgi:hypothetical protein